MRAVCMKRGRLNSKGFIGDKDSFFLLAPMGASKKRCENVDAGLSVRHDRCNVGKESEMMVGSNSQYRGAFLEV